MFQLLTRTLSIAIICIILAPHDLAGQRLEKFSENRTEFVNQLKELMTASKRKVLEDVYKDFATVFNSGVFSEEEVMVVLQTGNKMLDQRMTASPYFSRYLQALTVLKNKVQDSEKRFTEWHLVLDGMLDDIENRRLKPFEEFLSFSQHFFEHSALRYSTGGTSWLALAEDYQIKYADGQPQVVFEKLDLQAIRKDNKIQIQGTSGKFLPVTEMWYGKGGKVTWERFDLEEGVYAELTDYEFEVKRSLYEVKKVKMHYPLFFGERAIEGSFRDKLVAPNTVNTGSYPSFTSKDKVLKINNIGEGIEYTGGFRLEGTTVYGYGSKENPANIKLFDKSNQKVFNGASELFKIRREVRIVAERVESTIYFASDSIYHPSVNVRFEIPTRSLQLTRGDRGSDRNPFYNSLHQMNIDAEKINAYLDADSIVIGEKSASLAKALDVSFESFNYFKPSDYQRIQNIATSNPLAIMKVTAEREGTNFLDANLVAKRINSRFTVDNIQSLIYDLVAQGFINYDNDNKIIEVKDKVYHYVDAANEKVDYDVLKIRSQTDNTNAVLRLKEQTITASGVNSIELSAKQKVALQPVSQQIVMNSNRDIDFDGKLYAGFGTLEGKDFHFDYEKFQIDLDSVRFFDLFVPNGDKDKNGNLVAQSIASRIEHLTGVLLIDAPNNKSGKDDIDIFPSLQSKDKSYIFYDYSTTQAGAYGRDTFFFELDKFGFNKLDQISAADLKFEGTMVSAGVFPEFRETVVLNEEDASLGFKTETPATGYDLYRGKGKYKGSIDLSNSGMLGAGNVKYLGASLDSEDWIFKPSQMTGSAERFDLEEDRNPQMEVPQVRGEDVTIDWRPYRDSMYVRSKEKPFELFKANEHTLTGTAVLSPGGLKGIGLLDWSKANMTSELFNFGAFSAQADTTDINIRAFNTDELALKTSNLNGFVDFDEQVGTFKANDEFLNTTLPYNQYETSMNEFDWDIKEENITFKAKEGQMGKFLSIHPNQDSLRFEGKTAFYDLKTNELQIGGVPYIVAADAFVYPDSGAVEVLAGGIMTKFNNAKIVADTLNQYHVINRATVNIKGRKDYVATGFYEYNIGDRNQEIEFANIVGQRIGKGKASKKNVATTGTGEVGTEDNFYIDHKTEFRGKISLNSGSKDLTFDGFARLDAPLLPARNWFTIKSEADKKDLAIQFDVPKNYKGEPLRTGMFLSKETANVYPRVMAPLYFRKDRPILPAKGIFKYNQEKDEFIFGDSLKVIGAADVGNMIVYQNKDAKVRGEGKFDIGSGLKYIKVNAAGRAFSGFQGEAVDTLSGYVNTDAVTAEFMAAIDLIIPEKLLNIVANDIVAAGFDATNINFLKDKEFFRKAATELFGDKKESAKAIIGLEQGTFLLPKKENPHTFLFSKLPMKWDRDYQSFVSSETKLGLTSIAGELINKMITAYVEFKMPTNDDDRLYVYLKSPSELYYYFGYKQGILSLVSNNTKFMEEVENLKKKEMVMKMKDGETYEIQPINPNTAKMFIRRVEASGK
ncbi:MAG: hypothetical protein AB8G22_00390 [Saprospiraceae bacterium]